MKDVVVTGAAGFIGSHQSEILIEEGYRVHGIDSFHPYYCRKLKEENLEKIRKTAKKEQGEFRFTEGSILEGDALQKLPESPEMVFHLAAVAGTRSSFDNPSEYTQVNVLGTSRLLQYLENPGKFLFTSSSSVYGEIPEKELPVRENRDLRPETPYSVSKSNAEELVRRYSRIYGFEHVITRPFTVYGPRQRPDELFTKFISMIESGEALTVYGDGTQSRDFTHVEDVVKGNLLAARHGDSTYNIATGRRVTVNEVVELLKDQATNIEVNYLPEMKGDVSHTHADISKAERELSYTPQRNMEDSVEDCFRWVREMMEKGLLRSQG